MKERKMAILSLLLVLLFALESSGTVIGIDLGSNSYKVMLVQGDFQIVLNEQSARKTASLVAFRGEERFFGGAAENAARWVPRETYEYFRDLLGKDSLDNEAVKDISRHISYGDKLFVSNVPTNLGKTSNYSFLSLRHNDKNENSNDAVILSSHELVAMLLQNARKLAEKASSGPVMDCAITVPVFFTQREREALLESASLAGLKVLSLINQGTAIAIKYAIDIPIGPTEKHVLFFDLGQSSLQLTLVNFSTSPAKKKGKTVPNVRILASTWEPRVSGREMDALVLKEFVSQLKAKHGVDAEKEPKIRARLLAEVRKSREILSANKERPFLIEGIAPDVDFRGSLNRDEWEKINSEILALIKPSLDKLLEIAQLTPNDISAIEMVGGPMRIPKVQEIVKQYFNREALDFHINADEAAVFGAAFYAAGISTQHRVSEMKIQDSTPWKVVVNVTGIDEQKDSDSESEAKESEDGKSGKSVTLFRSGNKYTAKKTLSFYASKPFQMQLKYDQEPIPLPTGASTFIEHYYFSGIPTPDKYNFTGTPKVFVQFQLGTSGIITVTRAETEIYVVEHVPKKTRSGAETTTNDKKSGSEEDTDSNQHDDESSTETEGNKDEEDLAEKKAVPPNPIPIPPADSDVMELEEVRRVHRVPLTVHTSETQQMPASTRTKSQARLEEYEKRDKLRFDTQDAKNGLEEYIYALKERLSGDEQLIAVSTEAEREKLSLGLTETSNWLEDEGTKATLKLYNDKKNALVKLANPILFRIQEQTALPKALAKCIQGLNATRDLLVAQDFVQDHDVTEEELKKTITLLDDLEIWALDKSKEQTKLEPWAEPSVTSESLTKKCNDAIQKGKKLLTKKRTKKAPKPPEPEERSRGGAHAKHNRYHESDRDREYFDRAPSNKRPEL